MPRILFVDDEMRVLQGLGRMLYSLRKEWDMRFSPTGAGALEALGKDSFDVIITDMRMPGMDGAEVLSEAQRLYPQVIRIVLSGHSCEESVMRAIGPAHQYLAKPCDAETLKNTVSRALALRTLLAEDSLKRLTTQIESIPSLPSLYLELMQELRSPDADVSNVVAIIIRDPGMTAKILQLVNSAFFGMTKNISDPKQAVGLLGLDTVATLALSVGVFTQFESLTLKELHLENLWNHSMKVASFAKTICEVERATKDQGKEAFLAGTLHDVGLLVLAANKPMEFIQTRESALLREMTLWQAEREILGATHAEVGAYLLGLWGFTNPIVEALAFHHNPSDCSNCEFSCLLAVHVANCLAFESIALEPGIVFPQIDIGKIEKAGLADHLIEWRAVCLGR